MPKTQCLGIIVAHLGPWGEASKLNYDLVSYLLKNTSISIHIVAHSVAPEIAEHPNVSWRRVPPLFGRFALGYQGRRLAKKMSDQGGRVLVNGADCLWGDVLWAHDLCTMRESRYKGRLGISSLPKLLVRRREEWVEKKNLGKANLILAPSEKIRKDILRNFRVDPSRVYILYPGNDSAVFHPIPLIQRTQTRKDLGLAEEVPIAVFLGGFGLNRLGGFDLLFGAWDQLCREKNWDGVLVALGTGRELNYWRRQTRWLRLEKRVIFPGPVQDVTRFLQAADVVVHPTFDESYSLSVQDALCSGVPAFVTECAANAERYPEELRSLLLPFPPTIADLTRRLRDWRENHEECRKKTLAFAESLRRRNSQDMAKEILEWMEED